MNILKKKDLITDKLHYRFLDWDTNYFGVISGRLTLKEVLEPEEWDMIHKLLNSNEFNVIDNINNNSINNLFIEQLKGAFVTDINFQFIKEIDKKIEYSNKFHISIQNKFSMTDEILDISRESYKYSRFFNDPYLNKKKAREIYCHWVKAAILKEDKYFITAYIDSKLVGYLLFSINFNEELAVIELISVHPDMERKSIGKNMVTYLEKYLSTNYNNINYLQVGTQSNNMNAINFYVGNGFKVKEFRTIYHYWPNRDMKFKSMEEVVACLGC